MLLPVTEGELQGEAAPVTWKGKSYQIVMGDDYPYAADGMLLWNALHAWLKGYLGNYYHSAADIAADAELKNWCDAAGRAYCCACFAPNSKNIDEGINQHHQGAERLFSSAFHKPMTMRSRSADLFLPKACPKL